MSGSPDEFERAADAMRKPTLPRGRLVFVLVCTVGGALFTHFGQHRQDAWLVGALAGLLGGAFLAFLPWMLRRRREGRERFERAWADRKDPFNRR